MTKPAEDRVAGEFNPAGRLIESSRWRLAKRDVSGDWGNLRPSSMNRPGVTHWWFEPSRH